MEDYEQFFARELTRAQNIIHITMTRGTSNAYRNATEAAKSFENVTVLDSELISGGTGMMVMHAAYMAKQEASKEEVLATVADMRRRIPADFIINDTQMLYQAGRFPKGMKAMCDALLAHPIVGIHRNKMTMGGIRFGDFSHAGRSYIRSLLRNARNIDKSVAFIIYERMNEETITQRKNVVLYYCRFERIYTEDFGGDFHQLRTRYFRTVLSEKREAAGSLKILFLPAAQDHVGGKLTVPIMEAAISAIFLCSMAHSLQADTFPRTLGGEKHAVFSHIFPS